MLKLSGPETVIVLVIAAATAVLGYALSESDRRKFGRTPWGLPSLIWALFWFLSWIVGLILFLFAHRAEVRRREQGPTPTIDAYGRVAPTPPSPMTRSAGSDFPAYPRPADGGDRRSPPADAAPPPPPAPASGPPTTPPSWQADPGGRFHHRWWSGTEWTSYVATDGNVTVDTDPDQRIGPYGPT